MTSPRTPTPAFVLPQTGIFAQGTPAHHFLEFDLHADARPAEAVSAFRGLRAPDVASGGVNLVLAFSGPTWRSVAPAHQAPPSLSPFRDIAGRDGLGVPTAQHDADLEVLLERVDAKRFEPPRLGAHPRRVGQPLQRRATPQRKGGRNHIPGTKRVALADRHPGRSQQLLESKRVHGRIGQRIAVG